MDIWTRSGKMSEQKWLFEEEAFSGTTNNYIVPSSNEEWHTIALFPSGADEIRELPVDVVVTYSRTVGKDRVKKAYIESRGQADRELSEKEIEVIYKLLRNHPEIQSWWLKDNVLHLEIGL